MRDIAGFVARGRSREKAGAEPAVDHGPVGVLRNEILVAIVLHEARDPVEGLVPRDAHELVRSGRAVFRVLEPVGAVHEIEQARALGAKRAAIHRMIRIALDMNDLGRSILGLVAEAVHQETAADRAVRAGVACLRGACQLVLAYLGKHLGSRESQYREARCAESGCTDSGCPDCTELEELTSGYRYH